MGALTRKQDRLLRRAIRDTGCPRAQDVLPAEEIQSRIAFWRQQQATGAIPADTCSRMISMYNQQLFKPGVNGVAQSHSAAY